MEIGLESAPLIIRRYFELAVRRDADDYFALFADDATVEDEGKEYHGIASIRKWRSAIPSVTYAITTIDQTAGSSIAVAAEISGEFPGSPVTLNFLFEDYDEHHIRVLRIRP
jgi:hypothetical protein